MVTAVRPTLQFGVAELGEGDRVTGFQEKPSLDRWINGGFLCFEPGALEYIAPDSVLEREPLERLAADGELGAYRHEGFWDCMDTYKDAVLLNDLWESKRAPWREWGE
jgi:glucose-1-phosphate cytidylyltransferase